ncbi:MAG: hypothetical protein GXP33_03160 [Spirochaetes bacterium]|nr:hypothetical protein [Spirochaetota bacterium]
MVQKTDYFHFVIIIAVILYSLSSCSLNTVSYKNDAKIAVEHIDSTGNIHYEIDITDAPVDIVFSFTNVNKKAGAGTPDVTSESIIVNGEEFPAPVPAEFKDPGEKRNSLHEFIDNSTRELVKSIIPSVVDKSTAPVPGIPGFDIAGGTGSFSVFEGDSQVTADATCQSVSGPVKTAQGNRTLNIWVANDSMEGTGNKKHLACNTGDDRHFKGEVS